MITNGDRNLLKNLFLSPTWKVLEHIADLYVEKINTEIVVKDSEWDTVKTALMNEGRKRGIGDFIKELLEQGNNQHDKT